MASKNGTWPRQSPKGKPDDAKSLLPESAERSDNRSSAANPGLKRRQSSVQFGNEATVHDAPGGFRGDGTKPPAHLEMKRKLSRPGLRMQESPFNDEVRTVRLALQVHNISGIDPASSTFFAAFTIAYDVSISASQRGAYTSPSSLDVPQRDAYAVMKSRNAT